ncbi:MAG: hypothetical protein ABJO86_00780 [Lentilitoribacter sp.]
MEFDIIGALTLAAVTFGAIFAGIAAHYQRKQFVIEQLEYEQTQPALYYDSKKVEGWDGWFELTINIWTNNELPVLIKTIEIDKPYLIMEATGQLEPSSEIRLESKPKDLPFAEMLAQKLEIGIVILSATRSDGQRNEVRKRFYYHAPSSSGWSFSSLASRFKVRKSMISCALTLEFSSRTKRTKRLRLIAK